MIYTQLRNAITVSSSPSMTTEDFEIIPQFDYAYDAAGRRTAITKTGSAFGDLSGSVDTYTYNTRSELTSARRTKNGQPIPGFSEDFDYDPIGNRRSSSTYNEKGEAQTSTYEANNLNQYTTRTTPGYAAVRGEADPNATVTVNENPAFRLGSYYFGSDLFDNTAAGGLANLETYATLAQTAANGEETEDLVSATTNQVYLAQSPEAFAYDDDGNQTLITTKTGLWRVTYNGENRPVLWVRDSDNTELVMSYDHMGRRREKNTQRFFYDGYLQVADNGGNVYVWDCTEPVATRPLAWFNSSLDTLHSALYYAHDGNKNVSEVVADDCSLVVHYDYASFGSVIDQRGTFVAANPWRFSSEFAEEDTATIYYNYRYCKPENGCWLVRDPIGEKSGAGLYSYLSNKLGTVDLLGLYDPGPCRCCCVDSLAFSNISRIDQILRMGHSFDVIINMSLKESVGHSGDCSISWKERTNVPYGGLSTNVWVDLFTLPDYSNSPTRAPWDARSEQNGRIDVTMRDAPSIEIIRFVNSGEMVTRTVSRKLEFDITVDSAPGCPCANASLNIGAVQVLNAKDGVPEWNRSYMVPY